MAVDNKTLGRFELVGIPPAPRGVPQIEVAFDIDANGILHVSAKDKGTGKEQSIKITASSGLTEAEIQQMIEDAQLHQQDDHRNKALAEERHSCESLIYNSEKTLRDYGAKMTPDEREAIQEALDRAREVVHGSDVDKIRRASKELGQLCHKFAAEIYRSGSEGGSDYEPVVEDGAFNLDDDR